MRCFYMFSLWPYSSIFCYCLREVQLFTEKGICFERSAGIWSLAPWHSVQRRRFLRGFLGVCRRETGAGELGDRRPGTRPLEMDTPLGDGLEHRHHLARLFDRKRGAGRLPLWRRWSGSYVGHPERGAGPGSARWG